MVWWIQHLQTIGIGMVAIAALLAFGPLLIARVFPAADADDDVDDEPAADEIDVLDMAALRRLQRRFERLGCQDGQAAIETCAREFFVEHHAERGHVGLTPQRSPGSEVRA